MATLSNFLNWLLIITLICVTVVAGRMVCFFINYLRMRRKLDGYADFIEQCYTQKGVDPPAMILRIQNEAILDYNRLTCHWIGLLFHLRKYPENLKSETTKINSLD